MSWLRPCAVCGIVKSGATGTRCRDPAVHFAPLLRVLKPAPASSPKWRPLNGKQRGAISQWQVRTAGAMYCAASVLSQAKGSWI